LNKYHPGIKSNRTIACTGKRLGSPLGVFGVEVSVCLDITDKVQVNNAHGVVTVDQDTLDKFKDTDAICKITYGHKNIFDMWAKENTSGEM